MLKKNIFKFAIGLIAALTIFVLAQRDEAANIPYTGAVCQYHGVADSLCSRCHPELVAMFKARNDWCSEHNLPESQCYLCNPELRPESPAEHEHDHAAEGHDDDAHDEHDHAGHAHEHKPTVVEPLRAERPLTTLNRKNADHCATDEAVIQLASIQTAERAGLQLVTVRESPSSETVSAPAEVEFDATESYAVASLLEGTLVRWVAQPGDPSSRAIFSPIWNRSKPRV